MDLAGTLVLPPDVDVVRADDLPDSALAGLEPAAGDWIVTRPRSRTPSRVIDDDLAALLLQFRKGSRIVDAVIAFCRERARDPQTTLEEALPSLMRFVEASWLVPVGSPESEPIDQSRPDGCDVGGYRVVECVKIVEDTELYRAAGPDGDVAVKLLRHKADPRTAARVDAEIAALHAIGGPPAPTLRRVGLDAGQRFLATEWCDGVPASARAAQLRHDRSPECRARLHALCVRILEAYETIHGQGVIHGDVHPGNVLVGAADMVRLVDFGLARSPENAETAPRGGVPAFFDPQYAAEQLAARGIRPADHLSEQYSLGALLYLLITGHHYVRFSPERPAMLRQIIEEPPAPFAEFAVPAWPRVEEVLARALAKSPDDRFATTSAFVEAMREAGTQPASPPSRQRADGALRAYVDRHVVRLAASPPSSGSWEGPRVTVMFGSAGVAYGLYRIAAARNDAEILAAADSWATAAVSGSSGDGLYDESLGITQSSVGRVSPYHTDSGVHAVQAIVALAMGDFVGVRRGVEAYLSSVDRPASSIDATLGRSSVLVASALLLDVLDAVPAAIGFDGLRRRVRELGDDTMRGVWSQLGGDHVGAGGPSYLGIAHGWAGICYASLTWCQAASTPLPEGLTDRLAELAGHATATGDGLRWPIQADRSVTRHTFMNSWCNGAPGFVFLWNAAHARLGDPRFAELAEGAAQQAWRQRDAIAGICCGYAGRAYALLNHFRHTDEPKWLDRAHRLTGLARQASSATLRNSLYKGELGVVVLAAEMEDPLCARLPFFEREA